ncbi:TrkH family potassium uptake protein [Cardiobacteriaceae bacterium TAE3-ERU3]|nr:TrkH family potassium uptake protein [Cardiobacteriaceae bacterium TAE3-ERU3]
MNFFSKHPPAILTLGFLALVLVGAFLLSMPFAAIRDISIIEAIFTATSAVTVTGLAVVSTDEYTVFGQMVIAVLIQLGGLGFMTFAVLAVMSLHGKFSMTGQMAAQEALGNVGLNKIFSTAKSVVVFSLIFESIAFVIMTLYWWGDVGLGRAMYQALFYSISAFNNAGFALSSDSLIPYAGSFVINMTVTLLIIIGGLGFLVLVDIRDQRRWSKLSLNSRLVIMATVGLNLFAFAAIWLMERNNINTMADMSWYDQALRSWFQAVTPRTAGFNTIPTDLTTDGTTFLTILLMFVGGGSLSTASGLKIGTFVVLLLTTWSYLRQQEQVTAMGRTIPERLVKKALAVTIISLFMMVIAIYTLLVIEDEHNFLDVTFEVISALSTVGLSRGITGSLSELGEFVIIIMMFAGRLGPLTLAYFIALPKKRRIKYPDTNVQVG